MKTSITVGVLHVAAGSAFAVFPLPFTSWDDLTRKTPDIIIARCAVTPPLDFGEGTWSDIEVMSVLKGDTKPGVARMVSQHWPRQAKRFLMFSTYQSNHLYRAYNASETYRVVPSQPKTVELQTYSRKYPNWKGKVVLISAQR